MVIIVEEMVEDKTKSETMGDGITQIDQLTKFVANLIQSTAYFATAETIYDSAWYADSGATNHVTSDLNNLTMPAEYQGRDRLAVGNGQQLNISHIDHSLCSRKLQVR
ncbi:hypothetical protein ACOSQ4_005267 [Xanthoceras sorbifolium]